MYYCLYVYEPLLYCCTHNKELGISCLHQKYTPKTPNFRYQPFRYILQNSKFGIYRNLTNNYVNLGPHMNCG